MADYEKTLYHPDTGNEVVAYSPEQADIYEASGHLEAPEPVAREGYALEPVKYVQGDDGKYSPEEPEKPAKPASKASKSTSDDS